MNDNEVAANDVGDYERGENIKEDEDERGEYIKEDEDERGEYLKEDEDERGEHVWEVERIQEKDEGARKFVYKNYVALHKNCFI